MERVQHSVKKDMDRGCPCCHVKILGQKHVEETSKTTVLSQIPYALYCEFTRFLGKRQ